MSDLAVVTLVALLSCWACAAFLGLVARSGRGMSALRFVLGSARGALLLPPLVGIAAALSFLGLHRSLFSAPDTMPGVVGDAEGCIHWLVHPAFPAPTLWAGLLGATLVAGLLLPLALATRARRFGSGLIRAVDRDATRKLRTSCGGLTRLFAVRALEDQGPLALVLPDGAAVFLPRDLDVSRGELAAIIAHERAHVERGHLMRRWVFEDLASVPMPAVLVRPLVRAARVEEECEADDDAARAIGSRALVARALVRITESVLSSCASQSVLGARMGGGDGLRERVERLLTPTPSAPPRFSRALACSALVALALVIGQTFAPEPGLWMFCHLETLLGVRCC